MTSKYVPIKRFRIYMRKEEICGKISTVESYSWKIHFKIEKSKEIDQRNDEDNDYV